MATTNKTHVNFVKVASMSSFNDLTTKVDGTIYFIVDAKKIYLDGVMYGFNDSDVANKFLKLTGGEMSGDIDMDSNYIRGVNTLLGDQESFALYSSADGNIFTISHRVNDQHPNTIRMYEDKIIIGDNIEGGVPLTGIKTIIESDAATGAVNLQALKNMVLDKKGKANGFASLNEDGVVPSGQLPSYVDDVLEYPKRADFPDKGEPSKLYLALDKGDIWRWSGSTYVRITDGSGVLVLGETSSTAYRGDHGKKAYDHSLLTSGNPHGVTKADVKLGKVQNYEVATREQAKAGEIDTAYMTPIRTKEAIAELAPRLSWDVVA